MDVCTKFHEAALPDGGDMLVDRSSLCNFPSRLKLEAEAVLDEVMGVHYRRESIVHMCGRSR